MEFISFQTMARQLLDELGIIGCLDGSPVGTLVEVPTTRDCITASLEDPDPVITADVESPPRKVTPDSGDIITVDLGLATLTSSSLNPAEVVIVAGHDTLPPENRDISADHTLTSLTSLSSSSAPEVEPVILPVASHVEVRSPSQGSNKLTCGDCKKQFTRKDNLARHRKTLCKREHNELYKCQVCSLSYRDACSLQRHVQVVHQGERLQCPHCDKVYKTKTGLQMHIRGVHEGSYRFLCGCCGQGFNMKTTYEAHVSRHLNLKQHSCDRCTKSFVHPSNLSAHKLSCGVDTKRFECSTCKRKFKLERNMKEHEKSHTNPQVFQCPDCGKTFAHRASIKRHTESCHRVDK